MIAPKRNAAATPIATPKMKLLTNPYRTTAASNAGAPERFELFTKYQLLQWEG
jgi:hypothetical protein